MKQSLRMPCIIFEQIGQEFFPARFLVHIIQKQYMIMLIRKKA